VHQRPSLDESKGRTGGAQAPYLCSENGDALALHEFLGIRKKKIRANEE
jgi:hypothetical protein